MCRENAFDETSILRDVFVDPAVTVGLILAGGLPPVRGLILMPGTKLMGDPYLIQEIR